MPRAKIRVMSNDITWHVRLYFGNSPEFSPNFKKNKQLGERKKTKIWRSKNMVPTDTVPVERKMHFFLFTPPSPTKTNECPFKKGTISIQEMNHLPTIAEDGFPRVFTNMAQRKRTYLTRWWQLKYFWNFHPECLGKMNPFWRAYFSNGLVQPPTSWAFGIGNFGTQVFQRSRDQGGPLGSLADRC